MGTSYLLRSLFIACSTLVFENSSLQNKLDCIQIEIAPNQSDTISIINTCSKEYYIIMTPQQGILFSEVSFFESGMQSSGHPDHFGEVYFRQLSVNDTVVGFSNFEKLVKDDDSVKVKMQLYTEPDISSPRFQKEFRLK